MSSTRLLLAGCLVIAACGTTTQFAATNPSPRPMRPRPPETVHLFTVSAPAQPFVEVGIVEAQQASALSQDRMPEILAALRGEAARHGCDALIVSGANDAVTGEMVHGTGSVKTLKGYRGTCIMYLLDGHASR